MANQDVIKLAVYVEELLNILTDDEILSLAATITGGLLKHKISSREDASKIILKYSEDVRSILRRKVLTREKLISYLYDKNVSVKLPITKPEIIDNIMQLWIENAGQLKDNRNLIDEISLADNFDKSEVQADEIHRDQGPSTHTQISEIESSTVGITNDRDDIDVQINIKLLAEQFSNWFYKLINENELSQEHFFEDINLNLVLISDGVTNSKSVTGNPMDVTDTLQNITNQYNLVFNPNLIGDSLKAQMESHGIVMIVVKGTLHANNICIGVFDQMFSLARDPFAENNWKIKRTDVRLMINSTLKIEDTNQNN